MGIIKGFEIEIFRPEIKSIIKRFYFDFY